MRLNHCFVLAATTCLLPMVSLAPAPASAQTAFTPANSFVAGDNGIAVSSGNVALIKVVRPNKAEAKKDPLSEFGAGFTIVAFNKSGAPFIVGPESIMVKNSQGQPLEILTTDKLAELKRQKAEAHRNMGMLFGFAAGMLGAVGSSSSNAVTAANSANLVNASIAVMQVSNNNADTELSQTDALAADYNSTLLASVSVQPLHAISGTVRVNGIKDKDPATLIVTINGEAHEIRFDRGRM